MPLSTKQHFRRGIALIRNFDTGNKLRWLAQYSPGSRAMNFIMGQRLEGESFREAVMREVAWNLDIDRQTGFLASKMAQLNLEFEDRLPGDGFASHIHVAFYNIEVYKAKTLDKIAARDDLIWLTSEEICDGQTKLGVSMNPTLHMLLSKADVIQRWETEASQHEM